MKKSKKKLGNVILKFVGAVLGALIATILVLFIIACIKHKKLLKEEAKYLTPPGEMVEIDGRQIHVIYKENENATKTLVFIHGNKEVDDSIALEPLFENLSDYNLVYVDRTGVGFSEDADTDKDVDAMLDETRKAVQAVCDSKEYILVPIKSGGLIAFDWVYTYPSEISAIVGLQMYFPDQYAELDDNAYSGIGTWFYKKFVSLGAHRYASSVFPTDNFSIYTDKQMKVRNALVAKNLYTEGMYEEDKMVVKNGKKLIDKGWPEDMPMLLVYANPFSDPYLHDDEDTLELYNQILGYGEEYDAEKYYNSYYEEYLQNHKNVEMQEVSSSDQLIVYNPQKIAEMISNYVNELE